MQTCWAWPHGKEQWDMQMNTAQCLLVGLLPYCSPKLDSWLGAIRALGRRDYELLLKNLFRKIYVSPCGKSNSAWESLWQQIQEERGLLPILPPEHQAPLVLLGELEFPLGWRFIAWRQPVKGEPITWPDLLWNICEDTSWELPKIPGG